MSVSRLDPDGELCLPLGFLQNLHGTVLLHTPLDSTSDSVLCPVELGALSTAKTAKLALFLTGLSTVKDAKLAFLTQPGILSTVKDGSFASTVLRVQSSAILQMCLCAQFTCLSAQNSAAQNSAEVHSKAQPSQAPT